MLQESYADDGDFAGRAAQIRLRAEEPARDLTDLSDWIGRASLAAALVGAEPVATTAAVAQILVDLGGLLVKLLRALEQQLGADAFLDPSRQLAVPPTYSSLAVDLLLVGLDVFSTGREIRGPRVR